MSAERKGVSLITLAQEAGFNNMHDMSGLTHWFNGTIMSDKFEVLYFRGHDGETTEPTGEGKERVVDGGTVDIFGIVDPYDYDSCALYRFRADELRDVRRREGMSSAIWIDKRDPMYRGEQAVAIVSSLKED
jgi:hypothetical protein